MLYHLLYPLHQTYIIFNIFKYITFRSAGAALTAFLTSVIFAPFVIKRLKKLKISQGKRVDIPGNQAKESTPTMGGVFILSAIIISTLLWADLTNRFVQLILFVTIWLGALGFLDDYLKIKRKGPRGLSPRYKLIGQLLLAAGIGWYLCSSPFLQEYATKLSIPFFKKILPNLGWFYIPFIILVIVGSSNAVNLTDGLDGLAIGLLLVAGATYALLAYLTGHSQFSEYLGIIHLAGSGELAIFLAGLVGACLGFLWFNAYPAQVIMGDTGSLALGGALGTVAVLIKKELLLVIVGGVFVLEALSVGIQVVSFKLRGKRVFKMAPIHHHFQLLGWAEPKIIVRLWIVGLMFALLSLMTLKLR
jgi:phospho-N-acetylmuramoyl-pentapeptide-transferase